MKDKTTYIIGGIVVLGIGYYFWNKYQSRKAIVEAKDNELSASVEIPKMYIRSGINIPAQSGVKMY